MAQVTALISPRGKAPKAQFGDVLLAGPAPDGGLYLPERWPHVSREQIAGFKSRSYAAVALETVSLFAADTFAPDELAAHIASAYAGFSDAGIAPLVEIGSSLFLLELFHGPTLAFKDIAMQVLGRL